VNEIIFIAFTAHFSLLSHTAALASAAL